MAQKPRSYVAGVCNISREEGISRWISGWIGLGLTLAFALMMVALHISTPWRFLLVFPAFLSASGFLQGSLHFCANYGLKGMYNLSAEAGVPTRVDQPESVQKDKANAWKILRLSAALALLVTLVVAFLVP